MVHTDNMAEPWPDNGYSTDDTGFGLVVCDHIGKSCDGTKLRKSLKKTGVLRECPECVKNAKSTVNNENSSPEESFGDGEVYEFNDTLWICLQCGVQLCGRAKNQHALMHNQKPHSDEHNLTLNTSYFTVWCYICDRGVAPNQTKKLQSCVDMVKRECNKLKNDEEKEVAKPEIVSAGDVIVPPIESFSKLDLEDLPRVRGLSNLGNTCFFNAVLQCLSQTPFLLKILKESEEPGEKFELPGGKLTLENGEEILMKRINGELNTWGNLTKVLAETLETLQSGVGGVVNPRSLLNHLSQKWPQFGNGDQQDSHELLRHLLESVRCEDLRRYQSIILKLLGYSQKSDPARVDAKAKQQIKFYGNQASDRILRPEQVFRGFLVSTLTCQDCHNTSSRHESFLDISLPIQTEKPHPPMRRKSSPEPQEPSKHQSKKEKERERRAKRAQKKQHNKENSISGKASSSEHTDGDVEDNDDDPTEVADSKKKVVDDNGNAEKEVHNEIIEVGISQQALKMLQKTSSLIDQVGDYSLPGSLRRKRQRTVSVANWSSTLVPKDHYDENECSVQSCLNSFTWTEYMTGNNKVTCDACTERINGKDEKNRKSIYTVATKQLLISSPPAVLILHLKRFQVGPRGMFRKINKHVTFPLVLDIAPFCASKVKKLDNVRPHQKQLPYSLYGIVEHSGTMRGGHYVAYVKVRQKMDVNDPRWSFIPKGSRAELDQIDEQKATLEQDSEDSSDLSSSSSSDSNSSASSDAEGAVGGTRLPKKPRLPDALPGQWYHVSDSRVSSISEGEVLKAEAYLLFYERIDICQDE